MSLFIRKSVNISALAVLCLGVGLFLLSGCRNTVSSDAAVCDLKLGRLDQAICRYSSLDSIGRDSVRHSDSRPLDFLFALTGKGDVTDSALYAYSCSRQIKMFTSAVDSILPALDSVESVLGVVDGRIRERLSATGLGDVYTIVSPYNQSIFTTDSLMLVGLNHYLGSNFEGYSHFEPYQRTNKRISQLPYDMVEAAVGSSYPMVPDDNMTVLNHLLYQGAIIEAKMQLIPDASLADALGYTQSQLKWMDDNESQAWNALIVRRLLYSLSESDAERLVLPAPATTILHPDAPGRAGRYIGYRIVKAYMEANPGTRLSYLLSPEFYNNPQTLVGARYVPGTH